MLDAADPTGQFRVVAARRDGVEYDVEPAADRLLIVHNADHIDSDLAWAPLDATSPEFQDAIATSLEDVAVDSRVSGIVGYAETGDARFISTAGDAAYVVIELDMSEEESVAIVEADARP